LSHDALSFAPLMLFSAAITPAVIISLPRRAYELTLLPRDIAA